MGNRPEKEHRDAGKSSFDLIDSAKLFEELKLEKGSTFLDAGCGSGQYALMASEIIGDAGSVYAMDLWEEGIAVLREQVLAGSINNIKAVVGDISRHIPIEEDSVDVCLMSTVLHGLVQRKTVDGAFKEIAKALHSDGSLAIMEFKKIDAQPGPPVHIRLTPEEVERIVAPYGFRKEQMVEVGPQNYLITFARREST